MYVPAGVQGVLGDLEQLCLGLSAGDNGNSNSHNNHKNAAAASASKSLKHRQGPRPPPAAAAAAAQQAYHPLHSHFVTADLALHNARRKFLLEAFFREAKYIEEKRV
jgi:hypothetical protein